MEYIFDSNKKPIPIRAILAADRAGHIGYDGQLIFNNPEDLKLFKEKTKDSIIVMGSKTFKSIGRILPGRQSIVMTHHYRTMPIKTANMPLPKDTPKPIFCIHPEKAIKRIVDEGQFKKVWIIGGATIYEHFQNYIQTWVVTSYMLNVAEDPKGILPKDFDRSKLITINPELYKRYTAAILYSHLSFEGIPYSIIAYQNMMRKANNDSGFSHHNPVEEYYRAHNTPQNY